MQLVAFTVNQCVIDYLPRGLFGICWVTYSFLLPADPRRCRSLMFPRLEWMTAMMSLLHSAALISSGRSFRPLPRLPGFVVISLRNEIQKFWNYGAGCRRAGSRQLWNRTLGDYAQISVVDVAWLISFNPFYPRVCLFVGVLLDISEG